MNYKPNYKAAPTLNFKNDIEGINFYQVADIQTHDQLINQANQKKVKSSTPNWD
jgi:hypothetical protein